MGDHPTDDFPVAAKTFFSHIVRTEAVPHRNMQRVPMVVACPHAGIDIPELYSQRLKVDENDILARSDRYTDSLTEKAPHIGIPQIISTIAPSIINVGRAADSIHPDDVRGGVGDLTCNRDDIYVNRGQQLGLMPLRTLYGDKPIYKEGCEPTAKDIQDAIEAYHTPYHDAIEAAVKHNLRPYSYNLLFDVHSCPSIGTPQDPDPGKERPDVIISNADGKSCPHDLVLSLAEIADKAGFSVGINDPYKGGYATQHYGDVRNDVFGDRSESIQIEFNRKTMGVHEKNGSLMDQEKFDAMQRLANDFMVRMAQHAIKAAECEYSV